MNVELRSCVRGARPLRRHAADDAQHLSLPAARSRRRPRHSWLLADGERTSSLERRAVRARGAGSAEARLGELPARCPAWPRLRRRQLEQAGGSLRRASPLRAALRRPSGAASRTSSTRSTSRRSLDVHPGYAGTGVVRAPVNLKRTLPETGDREYIAGFVDGWLAADGDPVEGRLVATALDRTTPRSTGSRASRRTPASSSSDRARKATARRTSASAAARSAGSTSRRARRSGA